MGAGAARRSVGLSPTTGTTTVARPATLPADDPATMRKLLRRAKAMDPLLVTKSGIMVGLGETWEEAVGALRDLRAVGTDLITIGQYLRPSATHMPVARYWTPEEFAELERLGMGMGFRHVQSGPLVRSSYHAWEQALRAGASV